MFNKKILGLVAVFAVGFGLSTAIAGEGDAPAKTDVAPTTEAPATTAKAETATPSPMHTMMKWVGKQVTGGSCDKCCPTTEEGAAAWRTWFSKKDAPLAGLRDAMVADGWNADKTISFFKSKMAKKCADGCDCDSCDKGAAGPAADGKSECSGCSKDGKCDGCDKGAAGPAADKSASGKAKSGCCGGDKECDGGGCSKDKGAAGPAADAPKTEKKSDCGSGCCPGCK